MFSEISRFLPEHMMKYKSNKSDYPNCSFLLLHSTEEWRTIDRLHFPQMKYHREQKNLEVLLSLPEIYHFLFSYGVSSRRTWSPFLCTIFFCESKTWRDIWYKWAQISQTNKQSISYNLIQLNDLIQLIDESEMLSKWIIYSRIIRIRVEYILFIISFIRLTYLTFVSFSLSISFSKQPNSASKLYPTLHLTRYSCSFRYFDIMNFVKLVETEWNQ